jgi:hypothetical protein
LFNIVIPSALRSSLSVFQSTVVPLTPGQALPTMYWRYYNPPNVSYSQTMRNIPRNGEPSATMLWKPRITSSYFSSFVSHFHFNLQHAVNDK